MQISPDWKCIHHFFNVSDLEKGKKKKIPNSDVRMHKRCRKRGTTHDQPLMMIIGSGKGMIIMLGEIADDEGGREEEEGEKEGGRGVG
jgi:hypothetical protein